LRAWDGIVDEDATPLAQQTNAHTEDAISGWCLV